MSGLLALCIALSVLPLSACTAPKLTLDPEELYALPELPERYTALNKQLSAIQESGAEYAAPVSGSNIQPVQMMDLDGDGREEALAFFRQSDGEKPLKIHIFTADDDNSYRQAAVIEGSGLAIYSVDYSDIDGDGRMEIIVGWRVSMDLQALAVYSLEPDGARELMRTNYVKYAVADLNKDGKRELTVLRANQDGEGVADCYVSKNGALTLRSSVLVSMTMAELSQQGKVTVGVLRSNDPALFITGVADGARAITDVLALRGGELTNLVLSAITGVSGEVSRFCSVYPMDINGDGVIDDNDRTVIGRGQPIHTGGFSNTFDFYGFDLNIFFQWSYGNDVLNANRYVFEAGRKGDLNQYRSYLNHYDAERNPNSDIPRIYAKGVYEYSGRVVEDGSYLRLKNITLGYTLPKKVLRKMHFDTMRIYLSLDNVCTWTNYSGVDPEVSTRNSVLTPGFDWSAYPRAFSVTGGISFTF